MIHSTGGLNNFLNVGVGVSNIIAITKFLLHDSAHVFVAEIHCGIPSVPINAPLSE